MKLLQHVRRLLTCPRWQVLSREKKTTTGAARDAISLAEEEIAVRLLQVHVTYKARDIE